VCDPVLSYLEQFKTPADIDINHFTRVAETIENLLATARKQQRNPIDNAFTIAKKFRDIGAPMEAYKLLKAESDFYQNNNIISLWRCRFFAYGVVNIGHPTESIRLELEAHVRTLRKIEKLTCFLPLFLNLLGNIEHVYKERREKAEHLYSEALQLMKDISNKQSFKNITGLEYDMCVHLIMNNYVELLTYIDRNDIQDKDLANMLHALDRRTRQNEYGHLLFHINMARAEISRGDLTNASMIVEEIIKYTPGEYSRYSLPAVNKIKALIHTKRGEITESVKYALKAFSDSAYYGNSLEETDVLFTLLNIFKELSQDIKKNAKIDFFKESGLIDAFIRILSYKDWHLGAEHSINVAHLARLITEQMHFSEDNKQLINLAALLHDVGKIMIPWYTLNKVTPLDDLDWELFRAHTTEGYRILKKLGLDAEAEIVLMHHERIDGSGYPYGITNPSIKSQIIAICDMFDAATSPGRRYRDAKSAREMVTEIERKEGYRFHPTVIKGLKKAIPFL
jgi:putative nucleotidyltransferase with HDIG domain